MICYFAGPGQHNLVQFGSSSSVFLLYSFYDLEISTNDYRNKSWEEVMNENQSDQGECGASIAE